MTVVDFYLKIENEIFRGEKEIAVTAASADMKSEFNVSLPDFEYALDDVEDYLCDRFMKPILIRAENARDDGRISEDEFNIFEAVMKVVEW